MAKHGTTNSLSRREVLKTSLIFSSGLFAGGWASRLDAAKEAETSFKPGGIHLLTFGDYGTKNDKQRQVAERMNEFAGKLGAPLSAVLALGDNFYGHLTPETFESRFDGYYSTEHLDCPFYALLGNHDYGPSYDSKQGRAKADMQLAYAAEHPSSRWKMPAKWYSFELGPENDPLVKVIYLDGNYFGGALTPQEKIEQRRWLAREMKVKTRAKWIWLASHFPVFSDTKGDRGNVREDLLREWGGALHDKRISLYFAGHDHNLQHLQVKDMSPDFIVSGGGGAGRYDVKETDRGFAMMTRGFNHIHVTSEKLTIQYINTDGKLIHAFERDRAGRTKVLPV